MLFDFCENYLKQQIMNIPDYWKISILL